MLFYKEVKDLKRIISLITLTLTTVIMFTSTAFAGQYIYIGDHKRAKSAISGSTYQMEITSYVYRYISNGQTRYKIIHMWGRAWDVYDYGRTINYFMRGKVQTRPWYSPYYSTLFQGNWKNVTTDSRGSSTRWTVLGSNINKYVWARDYDRLVGNYKILDTGSHYLSSTLIKNW